MALSCGIVGLPNVGKSTVFNALTQAQADAANYPFCTIEPNVGMVSVPDPRLETLQRLVNSRKVIPTTVQFVDIAGLVKGASQGEGLGNQFLGHIRQVDAIIHVVRCFDNNDITHVMGETDPVRDVDIINTELILCDGETIQKSLDKISKLLKSGGPSVKAQHEALILLQEHVQKLKPVRSIISTLSEDQQEFVKTLHLITQKPVLYVANVAEDYWNLKESKQKNPSEIFRQKLEQELQKQDHHLPLIVTISAQIEHELTQLEPEDGAAYLKDLGLQEKGLDRLIRASYDLLGLMTYFTAGEQEVRAWTIEKGTKAPQAAGVIHSDFEKGFICAEVYNYKDIFRLQSEQKVKEAGLLRKEGREYVFQDGDIVNILFNV